MAPRKHELSLGEVLRRRRHQLDMTQADVAAKVGCRPNYIGYLEAAQRHPSAQVVTKLAKALDLDQQELYFLANPQTRAMLIPKRSERGSTWTRFKANRALHTRHSITRAELIALQRVAALGPVRTQRDFLFILQTIRQALIDD